MHATRDRSHAANVANFDGLLTYIGGLGPRYKPGPDRLKITYLTSRLESTQDIMTAYDTALRLDAEARDRRRDLFATFPALAARVVRTFSLCNVSESTIKSAEALLKKIQGRRIGEVAKTEDVHHEVATETPAENSEEQAPTTETSLADDTTDSSQHDASQKSFTYMVQHLQQLLVTIGTATDYTPGETELKITSLEALLEKMKDANHETNATDTAKQHARQNRDRALYRKGDGLVKLQKDVKKYISIAFGIDSPQHKAATSYSFIDYPFDELDEVTPDPS